MTRTGTDYQYIIGLIQFLDFRFGIRFFITSKDFDILYRWWEKGIPQEMVAQAMADVVERCRRKGKEILGFSVFAYGVKKRYQAFLTLQGQSECRREEIADEHAVIREYLTKIPSSLEPLRLRLQEYFTSVMAGREADPEPLKRDLLELFRDDGELQAKADFFMRNLAPSLRKPELERTYRLNYLIRRFMIPLP